MKTKRAFLAAILLTAVGSVQAAIGDTYTFNFDSPSTGNPSQNPPYPSLLQITLKETTFNGINGVSFNLVGNGSNPATGFSSQSFFERLDFVYKGTALTSSAFSYGSGQSINEISYNSGRSMDSGYKSMDSHITVNWSSANKENRMNAPDSSSWFIAGTNINNFIDTYATSSNKPSPTFGILSATSYSLADPSPTPSNWVTTAALPVPEPGTWAMFLAGLCAIGFVARRRKAL